MPLVRSTAFPCPGVAMASQSVRIRVMKKIVRSVRIINFSVRKDSVLKPVRSAMESTTVRISLMNWIVKVQK